VSARDPHTNVYGVARTFLAVGTLGTLLFTAPEDIFRPAVGVATAPVCRGIARAGLFCLAGHDRLELARWIAIAVLAVVASGWRPRWTGVAHWYVAASLFTSALLVDGGDQVTTVLTLLLVPVTLTDGRRWHWGAPLAPRRLPGTELSDTREAAGRLVAAAALALLRLQVAGIYFHAATGKMLVPEWRDGTAVYYWFTDPLFGLAEPVRSWAMPLLANALVVSALTWGPMLLEVFLFAGLIAAPRPRRVLLVLGLAFHATIALVHGLPSFMFAMWGALVLYLRPAELEIVALRAWSARLAAALERRRAHAPAPVTPVLG
jgi:antimicrobial peptide system SdpB family protein